MASRQADDVRRIIAARAAAAIDRARTTGEEVPPREAEALERLARLLELHDAAAAVPPRRSWQLVVLLAVTLAMVSLLLFARVRETEVDVEIEATQVGFSIEAEQALLDDADLTSLDVSGLSRIRLPDQVAAAFETSGVVEAPDQAIRLSVTETNGRRGVMNIGEIRPARATAADVQLDGRHGRYRMWLQDPGITFDVAVVGPVDVAITGLGTARADFTIPQGLVLEPAAGLVELGLAFRDPEHATMAPQIPVSRLEFWRVDQPGDRRLDAVRTLSTILGGTLHYEELDGVSRSLRAGEILRFTEVRGEVRTLRLRDDRLSLGFHGRVRGMSTAVAPGVRSLMPTWLEWLRAQHGLSLLWGTTLYLAGLAVAALRWFKGPV